MGRGCKRNVCKGNTERNSQKPGQEGAESRGELTTAVLRGHVMGLEMSSLGARTLPVPCLVPKTH